MVSWGSGLQVEVGGVGGRGIGEGGVEVGDEVECGCLTGEVEGESWWELGSGYWTWGSE